MILDNIERAKITYKSMSIKIFWVYKEGLISTNAKYNIVVY